jgi:midasin
MISEEGTRPAKKRRLPRDSPGSMTWEEFRFMVDDFEHRYVLNEGKFAFAFVDGPLVKAIKKGSW